ncbi:MAG TPA: transcriptional repressor, partial [Pyrinomonadaceae bacterium]|nr:transcriptional repressor [Pyrinomonadaceae bacterium]
HRAPFCNGVRVFPVNRSACRISSDKVKFASSFAQTMTEEQEVFLNHIQKKGLKRTSQRDLILDMFLRTEAHLSSEDLYRLVRQEDPSIGQTTVYRTLKLLAEAGLAREVRFGDGVTHYEHNYKHQHHDHMICSECGRIIEFFSAELEALQDAMAAKHRFQVSEHLLRIIGVCAECRRAQRDAGKESSAPRSTAKQANAR